MARPSMTPHPRNGSRPTKMFSSTVRWGSRLNSCIDDRDAELLRLSGAGEVDLSTREDDPPPSLGR